MKPKVAKINFIDKLKKNPGEPYKFSDLEYSGLEVCSK